MRLLVLTQYFWPESFRINDIVEALAERGHEVLVYTGIPNYPSGRYFPGYGFFGPLRDRFGSVPLRRAPLIARGHGGGVRLSLNYLSYAFFATALAPWLVPGRFDAILVYEPSPITVGIPARALRGLKRAPLLFWVQDLWPESLSATGAVKSQALLAASARLVRWIYRGCDRILVQSEAFVSSILAHGVPPDRIRYLPNTAESFYRRVEASPDDAEARELPAGFKVLFAGNVGAAQDFPTIIGAAELLRDWRNIHWVIIGDGRMKPWVEEALRVRGLTETVHLIGHRPAQQMPRYFAHADVLLVTLRNDPIFAYTIPSKLQSYLACGRPIIAALEGEGRRIVEESGAGWVVPPQDPRALAEAVLMSRTASEGQRHEMGNRAEAFFLRHFERDHVLSRLESLLAEVAKDRP